MNDQRIRTLLSEEQHIALDGAISFIDARYQPIGVIASGSIIRGKSHPLSDLDMVVAHRPAWRQRHQRWENGIVVEIFVNPVAQIERTYREEVESGRPVMLHMIATGIIVVDTAGTMRTLQDEATQMLAAGPRVPAETLTAMCYSIATEFEDAVDILEEDEERAGAMATTCLVQAVRARFLQEGRWLPREKELLTALDALDPELGASCRGALRAETRARLGIVKPIVERIAGSSCFFAWEGAPQVTRG